MSKETSALLIIIAVLSLGAGSYFLFTGERSADENSGNVACTMEAKICPDGSAVGRTGPNCEFAPCPSETSCEGGPCPEIQDLTAGWQIQTDARYGFEFKYPLSFFDLTEEPKILVGDCNYSVFPRRCPDIDDIVINDQAADGGDINAIRDNLASPNYWKEPNGEKTVINNTTYCLYQTEGAGMSHVYRGYYYATVVDNKCLVVNLNTGTTNCDVYLPLEEGNTEQQKNYNDCLTTNRDQPQILSQILSTFNFLNQEQVGCDTSSDCRNGASCVAEGPIIAGQPVRKVCVPIGQAVPL